MKIDIFCNKKKCVFNTKDHDNGGNMCVCANPNIVAVGPKYKRSCNTYKKRKDPTPLSYEELPE